MAEVAVTLIRNNDVLLMVYSESWRAFTLPMTKRRTFGHAGNDGQHEDWLDAAARNVVECLGRASQPTFLFEEPLPVFEHSHRDGDYRDYRYCLFTEPFDPATDAVVAPGPTQWMTVAEIETLRPVSPTAVAMVRLERVVAALGALGII